MAKITGGLFSLGASGSLAKTLVASKWKGRAYMRQHVVPANPKTVAQITTRSTFANASAIWKIAPPLLQAPWDRFAVGQVLTGRNAFQGRWVQDNRGQADLAAITFSPGAKGGLSAVSMIVTPVSQGFTVDITEPALPTGWTIQAGVAAAIEDQDPETGTFYAITADEDLATPFSISLAGLKALTLYQVGGWLRWVKPDLSIAYGASIVIADTTLA